MRKVKRYNGEDDSVVSSFAEDANDRIQAEANKGNYAKSESYKAEPASDSEKAFPAKTSFKSAFAAARKAGGKSFEWEGKKYSTDVAAPKAKASKPAADDTPAPTPAPAAKKDSGIGPKNSFLTEERLAKSREAMKGGWSNPFSGISKAIDAGNEVAARDREPRKARMATGMKKGGVTRADGIARKGKTKGRMV